MNTTHKKHFTVAGGKTGAALKEAAKREKLAESDKDKAAIQAERAAFYQQKNAERKEAHRREEAEAGRSLEQSRLETLKAGGPVTFTEVGTTVNATVKGITTDPEERKKLYGALKAFRGGNYHVDLAPELMQFLSLEEQLIYEKFHSPVRGKH